MADTQQNNVTFQILGTLAVGGTSVKISNDINNKNVCSFQDASIIVSNLSGTVFERMKGTASAGTLTLSYRGVKETQTFATDSSLEKEWRAGSIGSVTVFASDIPDIEGPVTIKGDLTVTGNITPNDTTKPGFKPQSLTQAQINALPTTGTGFVYNSTTGLYQILEGGAWKDVDTGAVTPNASTTVAGKIEIATDAQVTGGTDTGETGALLVTIPSQVKKSISLKASDTTFTDTDEVVVNRSGEDKRVTVANAREALAASTTAKGTVEMATDAEALAGTDETRYINPKQLKSSQIPFTVSPTVVSVTSVSGTEKNSSSVYFPKGGFMRVLLQARETSNTGESASASLQSSTDNSSWTTVKSVTHNYSGSSSGGNQGEWPGMNFGTETTAWLQELWAETGKYYRIQTVGAGGSQTTSSITAIPIE